MEISDNNIRKIEELEDGSSVYEVGSAPEEDKTDDDFYANLALDFPEDARKRLSSFLLEAVEEDIASRKDWMDSVERVKPYLGFLLEDLNKVPFPEATRTVDTTLSTALIRFYAITRSELLPQSGPAGFRINNPNDKELEKQAIKNRDFINTYLTVTDGAYYPDFERFLLYVGFYGSGFKKVYYDQIRKRVIARFIMPEDFIVDNDCTSILESNRLTHVLHLSKREIILNQKNKIYRDVELPYLKSSDSNNDDEEEVKIKDGIDLEAYSRKSLFDIYEHHTYLDLESFKNNGNTEEGKHNIPLPYVVTIDKISEEILSIRRNWKKDDEEQQRINYFVQYNYLPGFGVYGLGLAQLIGTNAITLTSLLRVLVDAGKYKNLAGGLRVKGFKTQNNNITVGPGQWVEVDTGGMPLTESLMPLPYTGADPTLRELRLEIMNQTKELGSTAEMDMLNSKEDIPVGTALAFLETNNRIQTVVQRSIHTSLSQELQLLTKLFGETLETQQFSSNGMQYSIGMEDFIDDIQIIPVSDPSMNSAPQRIMKAEAAMQTALQAPQDHNMREVFKLVYQAQGLDEKMIESILKPELAEEEVQPRDPVSQVADILLGKPVEAAIWQDHAAYILILGVASQRPEFQGNQEAMAAISALITKHQAFQYQLEMQQLLGIELPPLEEIESPEVQNMIAFGLAQKLEESGATTIHEQPAPIDPQAVLMAATQQKAEETASRERIANRQIESDSFKSQLDFEKEKMKIESNEDIAILKSETELTKQGVSNDNI